MTNHRLWRPVGFLVLVLGLGLRLDTSWQALATLVIVAGGAATLWGLGLLARASVRRRGEG